MREKDDLDLLIDSALATYADPGPDAGLEGRVLAALSPVRKVTPRVRALIRWRWLPWAIALPIAAGLFFLWLSTQRQKPLPTSEPQQARESVLDAIAPHADSRDVSPIKEPHRHTVRIKQPPSPVQTAQAAPLPKLDVFPTPQPMTPEESALTAVVTQTPLTARQAVIDAESLDHQPVRIAEIQIPPLEPPTQGQN
jgi:hypothetical protein